jgi:hypothetical protein
MILLQRFFQICLFRAGPADVPASHWFLKLVLLIYFTIGVLVSHIDYDWQISLVASFTDTLLLIAVCWLLLSIRGLMGRYTQTVTAMAGAGSVIAVIGMPVLWLFRQVEPQGQITSLVLLLVMVVVFWSLLVTAHIFRKALDVSAGMAAAITVAYTVVSLIVVGLSMSGVA